MVRSSLVWVWWKEMVRVSPSATAFCRFSQPRKTRRAARPQRYAVRVEQEDNSFLRAKLTVTCDLALRVAPIHAGQGCAPPSAAANCQPSRAAVHRGEAVCEPPHPPRLPTTANIADAVFN